MKARRAAQNYQELAAVQPAETIPPPRSSGAIGYGLQAASMIGERYAEIKQREMDPLRSRPY
jgi:hypothetical protein